MAGDLIPPPSPAGRPAPEHERVRARQWGGSEPDPVAADAAAAAAPAEAPRPAGPPPFRSRFGFVLGALIGVALAAVGLALVLAFDASDEGGVRDGWSAWQPEGDDRLAVAQQIAEHVGPQYRDGAEQLVAVQPSGLEVGGVPLSGVAMRGGGTIDIVEGDAVMYTLNGLGAHGSIERGTPSEERLLLIRREALELALYTFRYADDVDMVVALLPPNKKEVAKAVEAKQAPAVQALFFRPGDLEDRLDIPLGATIGPRPPTVSQFTPANPEAQTVQALTRPNLFAASFQQGQDASAFLVLDPLAVGP